MKIIPGVFGALAYVMPMIATAQTDGRSNAADTAWQSIVTLRRPVSPAMLTTPTTPVILGAPNAAVGTAIAKVTPEQKLAADQAAADRARQVADAAKDFYTRYPTHANAAQARKIEATAALSGLKSATAAQEQAALRVAGDFRKNQANPVADRFDVALAMDRFQTTKTLGGGALRKNPTAYEKLADNLRVEFGDRPEVFQLYAGVAHQIETEAGHKLAKRIIQMPAPTQVKSQAQDLIERHALLGRPLDLQLTTVEKRKIDLKKTTGGPTVVYVWSGGAPASFFSGLGGLKKKIPAGTQWIYLFLAPKLADLTAARTRAPFAGSICHEPPQTMQRVHERLNLRTSPFVLVLNRQGVLSGYGPVDELPTLLAAANR